MKKLLRKETIIGFCVIVALVILFVGIEYLKGINVFKPSNYYYVVYEDSAGLEPAAPVTVNGYKVGQVKVVEYLYNNPGHILVELSLDKEMKLPVNSRADIDVSLLGTASVKLSMSNESTYYVPGDTIQGSVIPGMLQGIQDQVMPNISGIVTKVDTLLTSVNALVGSPALINTVDNLEIFTKNLNGTIVGVNKAVNSVPAILEDVNAITSKLQNITEDLNALSSTLATAPVDSTIQNVNRMSAELAELSAKFNNPDSSIGQLLNGSELYDNINNAISDLDSLFIDIKKNPKRYISIKLL